MIDAWRLVKTSHQQDAFTGEGARLFGGRWNRPGTAMIYVSGSLALAAMEIFVHIRSTSLHLKFIYFSVTIPDKVSLTKIDFNTLPPNWREEPPPSATKDIGTQWVQNAQSAVLQIPSAIVPEEMNYLLNPLHSDFNKIKISEPKPFHFDSRMWK